MISGVSDPVDFEPEVQYSGTDLLITEDESKCFSGAKVRISHLPSVEPIFPSVKISKCPSRALPLPNPSTHLTPF